jgi:L-iditol 2-dehydrogenase
MTASPNVSMPVALLEAPGRMELTRRPVPVPGPGEVLIRVLAVGVCGSDVHCYLHGAVGSLRMTGPIVLGHEVAGLIEEVGSGVPESRVGERVSLEPQRPCLACSACLTGTYNLCPEMRFFAAPPTDGALAHFATLPATFAHPLPDDVSLEAAALLEPVSCAVHSCRQAEIRPGSRVLIAGAGPIGLLLVQMARVFGATVVAITDPHEEKLRLARELGATHTALARDVRDGHPDRYDAFIDACGVEQALLAGIRALGPAGVAVLVGLGKEESLFPADHVLSNEISVRGSFRYRNTWPLAIELVRSGAVDVEQLVTGRFGLSEAAEALRTTKEPGAVKSVIYPAIHAVQVPGGPQYDTTWTRREDVRP